MTPVLLGLALAIPLAAMTASRDVGLWLKSCGLLLIPEETDLPPILKLAAENDLRRTQAEAMPNHPPEEAFAALRVNPELVAEHRRALPAPRKPGTAIDANLVVGLLKLREAPSVADALGALTRQEKAAVLCSAEGIDLVLALPY